MNKKILQNLTIVILIILNFVIVVFSSLMFYQSSQFDVPTGSHLEITRAIEYFKTSYVASPSKKQQVEDIFALYNRRVKVLYKNMNAYGKAIPIINIIILNPNIPINRFGAILAHELEHLKYDFVEHRVDYRSIIKLWESEIPYLKYQAYLAAKTALEGRLGKRYDSTNLLIKYSASV